MLEIKKMFDDYPFLVQLFNSIPTGIYICDEQGTMVFLNKATEKIDGISMDDVIGRKVYDIYPKHESAMMKILETGDTIEHFLCRYAVNNKRINQICNGFPIMVNGRMKGACSLEYNVEYTREAVSEQLALQQRLIGHHNGDSSQDEFDNIIGRAPAFVNCLSIAAFASQSDSSVFITGSTGTGKEVFAKAIHKSSKRKDKPFIAINCAAIPETLIESMLFGTTKGIYTGATDREGIFEKANGGTLFLDELNSMPLSSQAKLLRVIEERKVSRLGGTKELDIDVRFISSSNAMPQTAIDNKEIREDLLYRLSVINIMIPKLTDRKSDIILLYEHFIDIYNKELGRNIGSVSDEVKQAFMEYSWPGNVRQLKHCIESAMNFASPEDGQLGLQHVKQFVDVFDGKADIRESDKGEHSRAESGTQKVRKEETSEKNIFTVLDDEEKREILRALHKSRGNVTKAAELLDMSRQSLNYRMNKYGIKRK